MRIRRLHKKPAELEVTAFINLIVVLVPFLLSTAVFTRMSVMELSLPVAAAPGPELLKLETLQLEVVIRPKALEVGDRIGGLIQRISDTAQGHDVVALAALMQTIKARFPDERRASVLAEVDTPYAQIVQVMDAVREARPGPGATPTEQFPEIAIGDAPVRARQP